MHLKSVPPNACRQIEGCIARDSQSFMTRDLTACLYTLGQLIKRLQNNEITELSFNTTKISKILVNELSIKKGHLMPREKNMLSQVKDEISKYCSAAKYLLD